MSLNFVENNKTSIQELNVKVAELISNLNIDLSGKLSVAKCLKINGEVNKAIKSIKSLAQAVADIDAGDKAGVIIAITLETLNSDEVKSILSDEQRKELEDFCQDVETVDAVISLIDWVSDETLKKLDANNDGVVTKEELETDCAKRCKCCPSIASCWSAFFINVLCCGCGKDSIEYQSTNKA
jgi:hypothetical protein